MYMNCFRCMDIVGTCSETERDIITTKHHNPSPGKKPGASVTNAKSLLAKSF